MSRERHRWYLLMLEQTSWTGLLWGTETRNPHVHCQGLLARQRIIRFHRRPSFAHPRTGLPSVWLRSLGGHERMYVTRCLIIMKSSWPYFISPAPLEKGSKLEELVKGIRTRKGLKVCLTILLLIILAYVDTTARYPPSRHLLRQALSNGAYDYDSRLSRAYNVLMLIIVVARSNCFSHYCCPNTKSKRM